MAVGIENQEKFQFIPTNSTIPTWNCTIDLKLHDYHFIELPIEFKPESPINTDGLSIACSRSNSEISDNRNKHYHVKGNHIKNFLMTNFDNRAPIPNFSVYFRFDNEATCTYTINFKFDGRWISYWLCKLCKRIVFLFGEPLFYFLPLRTTFLLFLESPNRFI